MRVQSSLDQLLAESVRDGLLHSVASAIEISGQSVWSGSQGPVDPPRQTLFDAASLTKLFVATLALVLDQTGELPNDTTLGAVWPQTDASLARVSMEDLLRHRSGLMAWAPLYVLCPDRSSVLDRLLDGSLKAPAQSGPAYSDLGYILYGLAVEERLQVALSHTLTEHLIDGHGLAFWPGEVPADRAVDCPCDTAKEVALALDQGLEIDPLPAPMRGSVQDGNARFLGGLAGHAGVFVDLDGLLGLGRWWLQALRGNPTSLAGRVRAAVVDDAGFALGWRAERSPQIHRYGHLGFTGGSLWIDPQEKAVLATLAHRMSGTSDLSTFRRELDSLSRRCVNRPEG